MHVSQVDATHGRVRHRRLGSQAPVVRLDVHEHRVDAVHGTLVPFTVARPLLVAPALREERPPLLLVQAVLEVVQVVAEDRLPVGPRVELLPHPGVGARDEEDVAVHRELLMKLKNVGLR